MKLYIRFLLILLSAAMLVTSSTDGFEFVEWSALVPYFIVISLIFISPGIISDILLKNAG